MATEKEKDVIVEFHTGHDENASPKTLIEHLLQLAKSKDSTPDPIQLGAFHYSIGDLKVSQSGKVLTGIFRTYRLDDLPHKGKPGGADEELGLADDEGLIERNHFIAYKKNSLILWQKNGNGCRIGRLGEYVSHVFGETITIDPVLTPDSMKRLMRGETSITKARVRVARPTNSEMYPKREFGRDLLNLMSGASAPYVDITLSGRTRSKDPAKRSLSDSLKASIRELVSSNDVRAAKVWIDDDEADNHPIDLIADRLTSKQSATWKGKYPVKGSIYSALRAGREEMKHELKEIFGEGNNAIT